ncbi:hypothetical protein EGW08_016928 [Elysia chlorotica]|uniref:Josephin-2 n=1 Tax=Elysia chlorotica TaxID=188477 RepID=A0A3S0ZDR2_ELYCH|nr:hypothetical protein EGW08_016928 [Elysia chlorotica]
MSSKEKVDADDNLYHERQVKALCALHALNNLFQREQTFTKKDLDQICDRLSPGTFINPHRSMLGLGNYDVNVLMAALQDKGYETIWFDKRKNVSVLVPEKIMGFILNTPSAFHFGPLRLALHCKHWIALRWLHGQYMNLDSKLVAPAPIGDEDQLVEFLHAALEDGKKELLLVVDRDVYDAMAWRKYDPDEEEDNNILKREGNKNNSSEDPDCTSQEKDKPRDGVCEKSENGSVEGSDTGMEKKKTLKNCHDSEKIETS